MYLINFEYWCVENLGRNSGSSAYDKLVQIQKKLGWLVGPALGQKARAVAVHGSRRVLGCPIHAAERESQKHGVFFYIYMEKQSVVG